MLSISKIGFYHPVQLIRNMSVIAKSLKYSQFGEPPDVLKICEETINEPVNNEVLVKIIAAPINPADINTIQGKYPVKPDFPAIGGNECVGEVIAVGPKVTNIKSGDHVVPFATGLGTWTSYAKYSEDKLFAIPKDISIPMAATITVNPCTAYRMLKDFIQLKPGDTVIQNGANSAVGQSVHQLCKAWNINSIGIVRDRKEIADLKNYLKNLGATEVLTEDEIRTTDIFKSKKLQKPILALNCVGGKNATEITRHLNNGGYMITYGGMSREPVTVTTASLIFKDITFKGYWMTRWTKENFNSDERSKMFNDLFSLIRSGNFKEPIHEMISLSNYKTAMEAVVNFKGFTGKKFILDFTS